MDVRYRVRYLFALFLSVFTTVLMLVNPFLSRELVDTVIVGHDTAPLPRLLGLMMAVQVLVQGLR